MLCIAAALILLASDVSVADAQESQPSAIGKMASGLNPANWKMPSWKMPSFKALMPGQDEQARITKKKDGLFSEVGKTASNSWTKTKEVFNPKKLNPVNFLTASARTPAAQPQQESKPGFFHSLFNPRGDEPQDDATVTDFLSHSRPAP
ncbi:MAG: hypothetical protein AB8B91_01760 [Rubripirellula sp.]